MATVAEVVERVKLEVLEDIEVGTVPTTVASFSELHDYLDANSYGGACEDGFAESIGAGDDWDKVIDFLNEVQGVVDQWLKAGRPEKGDDDDLSA